MNLPSLVQICCRFGNVRTGIQLRHMHWLCLILFYTTTFACNTSSDFTGPLDASAAGRHTTCKQRHVSKTAAGHAARQAMRFLELTLTACEDPSQLFLFIPDPTRLDPVPEVPLRSRLASCQHVTAACFVLWSYPATSAILRALREHGSIKLASSSYAAESSQTLCLAHAHSRHSSSAFPPLDECESSDVLADTVRMKKSAFILLRDTGLERPSFIKLSWIRRIPYLELGGSSRHGQALDPHACTFMPL